MRIGGICFLLMWIPFVMVIIALFQKDRNLFNADKGFFEGMMLYSFALVFVFLILSVLFMVGSFVIRHRQKKRIKKYGKPGKAKVISLFQTGTTINQNPMVGFELEVHPTTGAVFKTTTRQVIRLTDIPKIHPGIEFKIKYDPKTLCVIIV